MRRMYIAKAVVASVAVIGVVVVVVTAGAMLTGNLEALSRKRLRVRATVSPVHGLEQTDRSL